MPALLAGALMFPALVAPAAHAADATTPAPTTPAAPPSYLLGRAVLPAATFAPGPVSGQHLTGSTNGQATPFKSQPVQGFSGMIPAGFNRWLALEDNGYGSIENSADFNLRAYYLSPNYKTLFGLGSGKLGASGYLQFSDPDHKVPFPIVHQWTKDRVLTGADFDPESIQRAPDGTLWIGEEFGPSLLHFSATGKLLDAPYSVPDPSNPGHDLRSPQSPDSEESTPLRIMNALHDDAQQHGDQNVPIVSPDANLLVDNDPTTNEPTRLDPPAGSNVQKASSEIFNVASLHAAGYKVVPYTVDDPAIMLKLLKLGVDGEITDRPDLLHEVLADYDANGDGTPGDYLRPDGSVDGTKFDAEAHRGGRDLRPENTLPSMEVGLDTLVTTLETDNAVTKDGVPVLSHDPYVDTGKCRRTDGQPYTADDEVLIHDLTLAQLQSQFICDGLIRGASQKNDRALSPVAVAFAKAEGLPDAYTIPTAAQLYDFVGFYAKYYAPGGAGAGDPGAAAKAAEGARVRLNVETKVNPRGDVDVKGIKYSDRTEAVEPFTQKVAKAIEQSGISSRIDVQSFDFASLRIVHREFPDLLTVALFGDYPQFDPQTIPLSDDGTNTQPDPGHTTSPWLAGLRWPYRQTAQDTPFRAQTSGGFESMALTPDGKTLIPMLEKPLAGDPNVAEAFAFDLKTKRFDGRRWLYPYDARGVSVADFQLLTPTTGVTLERDNSTGTTTGFKAIETVHLGAPGTTMTKTPAADLLHISDPLRISTATPSSPGDVGLGGSFAFPFVTIEAIWPLSGQDVAVLNDNNYPFSVGRHIGTGAPDDDEFVALHLGQPIR
ncbi:MAG: esterase-like activity of phytase family protein [Solirubrobacteraceae bacterium]|nr:esterase-like activity of phytase family protein [Patulibacter sp.]